MGCIGTETMPEDDEKKTAWVIIIQQVGTARNMNA